MLRPLVILALISAPACAAGADGARPAVGRIEAQVIERGNDVRSQGGLPPLQPNPLLAGDARDFAAYLARTGAFSHTADGRDPGQRALAAGYAYCELEENIAYAENVGGMDASQLARLFVTGWERSPSHRRNMLNPAVTDTGAGVAQASAPGGRYVAVQEFGRPISMRFSFRIRNESDKQAPFVFDGQRGVVPARATLVETTCDTGELILEDGRSAPRRYRVGPGKIYYITSDRRGGRL